jgi:hypothetical protein
MLAYLQERKWSSFGESFTVHAQNSVWKFMEDDVRDFLDFSGLCDEVVCLLLIEYTLDPLFILR